MPLRRPGLLSVAACSAWLLASATAASAAPTKLECVESNERGKALRENGSLRAARAELATCESESCPAPVRDDCAARIAEIDRVVPTIDLAVEDASGQPLTDFAVHVDGALVASHVDRGAPLAIDPGAHELTVVPKVGAPWTAAVVLRPGEKGRRLNAVIDVAERHDTPAPGPGGMRGIAGLAVAGAGLATALVGGVLGVVAKVNYDSALGAECRGSAATCSGAGVSDVNSAHGLAAGATGVVVAGAVLAAGGVVLWATSRAAARVSPTVGGAAFALGGSF